VAILLALLSSAMWGSSDFLGGVISRRRPAIVVLAWAEVFGVTLCTIAAIVLDAWHGPIGWLWWGLAAGSAGSVGLWCYYVALASGTMGVVSPIASLGVSVPVFVGFLSGESPALLQVAGIVAAVIGIVLTSGPELSGGASNRPVVLAVVSGILFGVFFLATDAGAEVNTLMTLWAMRAGVTAFLLTVALVRRTTGGVTAVDVGLIAIVASGDLLANLFFGIASTMGFLSITSVLSSLYPVTTVLLARLVLHERLRPVQLVGVAVTMAGVALITAG
jgi:drug/metabolite transporter (DMT)-like permease